MSRVRVHKYFMIRFLSRLALHTALIGLVAACGGGGGDGGGGGTNPPTVTLSSITVTPASPSVVAGLTLQFTATGNYSDSTTKDLTSTVTWTSSDESKAIISATSGLATGKAAGTATITATYTNATTGTVAGNNTLTVAPPNLVSVVLSPKTPTLGVNKNAQFHATGTYTDNSTQDVTPGVTWSSSDTTILQITAAGEAKVQNQIGTAIVSAALTGFTISPVTVNVTATVFAYATNFDSDSVSQYQIKNDGTLMPLTAAGSVGTDHQPFSISVEPTGEFVYVSSWNSSSVSQFQIGADGTLSKIGTSSVATGSNPNSVTIDPFDKYAYVANLGDSTLSQYKIGVDGQLIPMATPTVPSGNNPATIVIDPTGHFAYAGNFGTNAKTPPAGPSTISQYLVSQTDGSLTAMNGAAATAPTGSGPVAIVIDPSAKYLYVANLGDNNVGQYTINTDGTLTPLLTVTATQGTVPSGHQPAGIAIAKIGAAHYVYVANQGDGTISQYTVGSDGGLTPMATADVAAGGTGTSSVTVDPTGHFVYATNRGGSTIAQFTIGAGGALSAATTVAAGTHPTSIATGY